MRIGSLFLFDVDQINYKRHMTQKGIFIVLFICFALAQVDAQITLTQASYPGSVIGTDTLVRTTWNSSLPSLAPAVDGTWDMSAVTDSTPLFYAYRVPSTSYQFADSNNYSFVTFTYQGNVQSSIVSAALFEYGININEAAFPLTTAPDSVFIPNQTPLYSAPRTVIQFPATVNSSWTSSYRSNFDYDITYLPALIHSPCVIRTYYSEQDTVVGWGKMRIKDATGSPSEYMSVLQVQSAITTIDTFLLNGVPASAALLTALGVSQGQKDTTYQMSFYRVGEVTPLAKIDFRDAAFTQTIGATYHRQRLPNTSAVTKVIGLDDITIYPNPVSDRVIAVEVPISSAAWSYELLGIDGRAVISGKLPMNCTHAQIDLPPTIQPGVYYLRLNNGQQISTRSIEICR